jgi:hypothetical protein
MRRFFIRICLGLVLLPTAKLAAAGVDYWVWHRTTPLQGEESAQLMAQGVKTLFWHAGEMEHRSGTWQWKKPPRVVHVLAEGWNVVPVVRLTSEVRQPFAPDALARLRDELSAVAGKSGALQIDFDCPDRLLAEYAAALRKIRGAVPHLSITALAQWPRLRGFAVLTQAVEEIAPMFYDLQADPTGVQAEAPPPALLDPVQFEAVLQPWKQCPIPWRAGLPTFARLTVFDRTGVSRGQVPNWTWEEFCFHKSLHTLAPTRHGVTLFRAAGDTRVASTPVAKDEFVASRFTDRATLARAVVLARAAGAAGVVLFRLPDGTGPGGWSLSDLGQLGSAERPRLILRRMADERLELFNDSPLDLPPRLSGGKGDRDRGYALEIDAPAPVFRDALPGDFWRVTSHAQPDVKKPVAVVIPLATRLTFWFSHLRGRTALQTGLLQLAPGARLDALRYRILNDENAAEWRSIAPAVPDHASP